MYHYYIVKEFIGNPRTPSLENQNKYISLKIAHLSYTTSK